MVENDSYFHGMVALTRAHQLNLDVRFAYRRKCHVSNSVINNAYSNRFFIWAYLSYFFTIANYSDYLNIKILAFDYMQLIEG